jgi:hypothetical protein
VAHASASIRGAALDVSKVAQTWRIGPRYCRSALPRIHRVPNRCGVSSRRAGCRCGCGVGPTTRRRAERPAVGNRSMASDGWRMLACSGAARRCSSGNLRSGVDLAAVMRRFPDAAATGFVGWHGPAASRVRLAGLLGRGLCAVSPGDITQCLVLPRELAVEYSQALEEAAAREVRSSLSEWCTTFGPSSLSG